MMTSTRCSPSGFLSSLLSSIAVSFIGRYLNVSGHEGMVAIQSLWLQHDISELSGLADSSTSPMIPIRNPLRSVTQKRQSGVGVVPVSSSTMLDRSHGNVVEDSSLVRWGNPESSVPSTVVGKADRNQNRGFLRMSADIFGI
jgi:hypothetical protein